MLIQTEETKWKEGEFEIRDKVISFADQENSVNSTVLILITQILNYL